MNGRAGSDAPETATPPPKTPAPFGTWPSPFSPRWLTAAAVRLGFPTVNAGALYWVEGRPAEGGRSVLVRDDGTGPCALSPAPLDVRSRVHEYGGRAYAVAGPRVFVVDDKTQKIHALVPGEAARAVHPPGPWRFGDLEPDEGRNRLIAVGERAREGHEPENALVAIALDEGTVTVLATGHDFFACPRLSPDGTHLAYLAWDHPHMPWDAAQLFVSRVGPGGGLEAPLHVAGDATASVFGPTWSPEGRLAFAWERDGFWNLFVHSTGAPLRALTTGRQEYALPLWQLGMSTFGWFDEHTLAAACTEDGQWRLERIDADTGVRTTLSTAFPAVAHLEARDGLAVAVAGGPATPPAIVRFDATGQVAVVRASHELGPDEAASVSRPRALRFPSTRGQHAHASYYPPHSATHEGEAGAKPPLIVMAHGGPTAASSAAFNPVIQFWTSRGFGVVDVDYRGSTGYGRGYREQLAGLWGLADVEDCVAAAQHLAAAGDVDPRRLAIRGSSAGGFTALAALTFHSLFAAGASLYGVADLEALTRDTHKFESRYLDRLVGPFPARADLYRERSPLYAVERLRAPVIFFQGLEDKVVPPSQAELMVNALRARGLPVSYVAFAGEQHGFRKAETIERVYREELAFYARVFGFPATDPATD